MEENLNRPEIVHASDTDEQIYSEDGVDLTLIRWMLSLTPKERLDRLQEAVNSLLKLRGMNYDS